MAKVGRPEKYDPKYCDMVVERMKKDGISLTEFACEIGHSPKILNEWKQRHPEFRAALNKAKLECRAYWLAKGRKAIDSRGPFRENLYKYFMAIRFDIREKQDIQTTNTNLNANAEVSSQELEEMKAKLRQAAKDAAEFS